ncbi:MAG: superoxide dismutase [Cu-Zn] SodC [Methylotenera sp.]
MMVFQQLAVLPLVLICTSAFATEKVIMINAINDSGIGSVIGNIKFSDSENGLKITSSLKGLTPGLHGLHIHSNPICDTAIKDGKPVAGLAAGGHYDPHSSNKHEGPTGAGHYGDLPALSVDANGEANNSITSPRLKLADIMNRAVIIHEGGDNYSDSPKPLGGGAGRIACGIIK